MTSSTLVSHSGAGEANDDGEVEMRGMNEVAKQDKEECLIQWQEKVFSQVSGSLCEFLLWSFFKLMNFSFKKH